MYPGHTRIVRSEHRPCSRQPGRARQCAMQLLLVQLSADNWLSGGGGGAPSCLPGAAICTERMKLPASLTHPVTHSLTHSLNSWTNTYRLVHTYRFCTFFSLPSPVSKWVEWILMVKFTHYVTECEKDQMWRRQKRAKLETSRDVADPGFPRQRTPIDKGLGWCQPGDLSWT